MKDDIKKMDIDLVYLWVDGSDPKWIAKRNAFIGETDESSSINCKGRYVDNDELKYSLRSVEKYATWIRKIFIVTTEQVPGWLDTANPRIKIIDHKDILPQESLPCFNPRVTEYCLYKIPDLSEHFIYANDDMFFNKAVSPGTFFASDGFPIIRLNRRPLRKWSLLFKEKVLKKPPSDHNRAIWNSAELVEKKYGIYYNGKPHHNIDAYLKSDWRRVVEEVFKTEFVAAMSNNLIRSSTDIERVLFAYVALTRKRGHLHYSTRNIAFHMHIHNERHYKDFDKYNPMMFCMNDSQYARDSDREKATAFLKKRFPDKSQFEN
jgi:hypothetical protein